MGQLLRQSPAPSHRRIVENDALADSARMTVLPMRRGLDSAGLRGLTGPAYSQYPAGRAGGRVETWKSRSASSTCLPAARAACARAACGTACMHAPATNAPQASDRNAAGAGRRAARHRQHRMLCLLQRARVGDAGAAKERRRWSWVLSMYSRYLGYSVRTQYVLRVCKPGYVSKASGPLVGLARLRPP
jgi:hypothetical protein